MHEQEATQALHTPESTPPEQPLAGILPCGSKEYTVAPGENLSVLETHLVTDLFAPAVAQLRQALETNSDAVYAHLENQLGISLTTEQKQEILSKIALMQASHQMIPPILLRFGGKQTGAPVIKLAFGEAPQWKYTADIPAARHEATVQSVTLIPALELTYTCRYRVRGHDPYTATVTQVLAVNMNWRVHAKTQTRYFECKIRTNVVDTQTLSAAEVQYIMRTDEKNRSAAHRRIFAAMIMPFEGGSPGSSS